MKQPLGNAAAPDASIAKHWRLPIEIRPNRGPSFALPIAYCAFATIAAFIWYWREASALGYPLFVSSETTFFILSRAPFQFWAIFTVAFLFAAYEIVRELVHFRAGADHYLRLTAKSLELHTPIGSRALNWSDIDRIEANSRFRMRGGIVYSIDIIPKPDARGKANISILQHDFARDLAFFRWTSAKTLQRFLDDARLAILEDGRAPSRIMLYTPKRLRIHESGNAAAGSLPLAANRTGQTMVNKRPVMAKGGDVKRRPTVVRD